MRNPEPLLEDMKPPARQVLSEPGGAVRRVASNLSRHQEKWNFDVEIRSFISNGTVAHPENRRVFISPVVHRGHLEKF